MPPTPPLLVRSPSLLPTVLSGRLHLHLELALPPGDSLIRRRNRTHGLGDAFHDGRLGLWARCSPVLVAGEYCILPVKRHRSRDTHGTHTGHAGAQGHTDHTDEPQYLTTIQTHQHTNTQPARQRDRSQAVLVARPAPSIGGVITSSMCFCSEVRAN